MSGGNAEKRDRFLLISVSTVGGSGSLRVQVWRKLRSLGALYLQQSVCLLPERDRLAREVRRLLAKVHAQGATGRVITIDVPDAREHATLVAEFNAARDAEYAEVLERTPAMLAEIAAETARGRATYAEVEESEADLDRFRGWLAKITARTTSTRRAGPPPRPRSLSARRPLPSSRRRRCRPRPAPTPNLRPSPPPGRSSCAW